MTTRCLAYTIAAFQLLLLNMAPADAPAAPATTPDRAGLRCISGKPFPPAGSGGAPVARADFESGRIPAGWAQGNGKVVTASDAPQGKAYFQMKDVKSSNLRSPVVPAQSDRPYFLSFWVKTGHDLWITISFTSAEREPSFTNIHTPLAFPDFHLDTGDQWKQEGFYFWMPPQCKTIQVNIGLREENTDGQFVNLDDIQLRTATEAEFSAASQAERANYPAYDATPRPGDGKNLALVIAKLEGKAGLPGKPFVIWALGSSFTDRQGDGALLIQAIRRRFPKAPPIIYRKHGGPGTPWEYIYCWAKQFVDAEQPDLIFTYTSGSMDGLEAMLHEIRSHTTAEIILPTLHLLPNQNTPAAIEHGMCDWPSARAICAKHDVEFIENRREIAAYLTAHHLQPDDVLIDHDHQNMHGEIRIWDNVFRHIVKSDQSTYTPESRERRIAVAPPANTATEQVSLSGAWKQAGGALTSAAAGDRLKISFTGNQIDLLGRSAVNGGSVKVLVDGVPGDQAPVFVTNFIQPRKGAWRIPHLAGLGPNLVPQKWTIAMTSDTGDFSVAGSVTGPDGAGNLEKPFTSTSGQITLDPKNWRQGRVRPPRPGFPEYAVATGDSFSFDVIRAARGELSFKAGNPAELVQPLVRNLPNGKHTVEIVTTGNGDVAIEGLYVFQPPEKY